MVDKKELDARKDELRIELDKVKRLFLEKEKNIEDLSKVCLCSVATIYSYFGGKVGNIHVAKSIIENANKILQG